MSKTAVDLNKILDGMFSGDHQIPDPVPVTDDQLDRLGTFFEHFNVHERYGLTFEQFVHKVQNGVWEAWLA